MPLGAIPWIGTAIAGGATAGASIYGAKKASDATRDARDAQDRFDREALELQREQMRIEDEQRAFNRRLDEYAQQMAVVRDRRAQPYRQASQQALVSLGDTLGIPFEAGQPVEGPQWQGATWMASGAPEGGQPQIDYQMTLRDLIGDRPLTTETMRAIEPELSPYGMSFRWNATGERPDVVLPTGQQIDFVQNMGDPTKEQRFQWEPVQHGGGRPMTLGQAVGWSPVRSARESLPATEASYLPVNRRARPRAYGY